MAQLLTLGQQLILSRTGALAAGYQDPRQPALDLESADVRAAAQLTLFSESTKASVRKQIAAPVASEVLRIKVVSTAPVYDVLSKVIFVRNAVPSRALTVWFELLAWFQAESLQVSIINAQSEDTVRSFYNLEVRAAVEL